MYPRQFNSGETARKSVYLGSVTVVLLLWLLPFLAILVTSVRPAADLAAGNYWGWPSGFDLIANYTGVFTETPMGRYFFNSLVITIPSVLGVLCLSTLTGFVLSRYRFRGNTLLFAIFIGGNFLPFQIMMIPVRNLTMDLDIYDTYLALILFHTAFQTGFATLFMRNFIAALPDELFEAARAEGASPLQTLIHVVVPLVRPALAALSILLFTFIWNDYFWGVVLSPSDTVKPVTTGLANLVGQYVANWNLISAATILIAIPPVVLFFFMQRHFVRGLTMGAVKG